MAFRHRLMGRAMRLWWRVRRPRTFGVRAIVLAPDDRIALVRHSYVAGWYLPGGGIDQGEGSEAAIRRELIEEIALTDIAIERVLGIYHNRAEAKDDHVVVFVVRVADAAALRAADAREIADVGWFAPDVLPDGTSPATRRRIAEHLAGSSGYGAW